MGQRLLRVLAVKQIVHVRDAQLAGEAGIDAPALDAALVQLLAGVVAPDDVTVGHAEGLEETDEEGRVIVHVQGARQADAQICPSVH